MRSLIVTVIDVIWIACLWLGLAWGIEGALNIGLFIAWLNCIGSLFCASEKAKKNVGSRPGWSVIRSTAFDTVGIALLVWHGYWVAGSAVTFSTLLYSGVWLEMRAKAKEKDAAL